MNIHDVRLDQWYKAPDGRVGQAAIIDNNLTRDVFLMGDDFSAWVGADMLEPADAPGATSDLERRVLALELADDPSRYIKALEQRIGELEQHLHKELHVTDLWQRTHLDTMHEPLMKRLAALEAKFGDHDDQLLKITAWHGAHRARHQMEREGLERDFDHINAMLSSPATANPDATPSEPLKVGDEVWVKGTVVSSDKSVWPYEIDLGCNARLWIHKSTEIERA